MTPDEERMIRTLDVSAAMALAEKKGMPFFASRSSDSSEWMTAEEVALMSLHKLRTEIGNKREARDSRLWLKSRRLTGLYGAILDVN